MSLSNKYCKYSMLYCTIRKFTNKLLKATILLYKERLFAAAMGLEISVNIPGAP